jgi:hypothetical protein
MKRKLSLVQQMWWIFGCQMVMAINMTAGAIGICLILLHSAKDSNRDIARLAPAVRLEIQSEQNPVKLRRMATTFFDETVSDTHLRESALRYAVKICAFYGGILLIYASNAGICAHRLGREGRDKTSSPTS